MIFFYQSFNDFYISPLMISCISALVIFTNPLMLYLSVLIIFLLSFMHFKAMFRRKASCIGILVRYGWDGIHRGRIKYERSCIRVPAISRATADDGEFDGEGDYKVLKRRVESGQSYLFCILNFFKFDFVQWSYF